MTNNLSASIGKLLLCVTPTAESTDITRKGSGMPLIGNVTFIGQRIELTSQQNWYWSLENYNRDKIETCQQRNKFVSQFWVYGKAVATNNVEGKKKTFSIFSES
jgi:hypothetical protein